MRFLTWQKETESIILPQVSLTLSEFNQIWYIEQSVLVSAHNKYGFRGHFHYVDARRANGRRLWQWSRVSVGLD